MEKGRNLAIFDFCDTLVNLQSADEFCRFVLERESKFFSIRLDRFFMFIGLYQVASKLSISFFSQKKKLLWSLKGLSMQQIEIHARHFLENVIEKRLNREVYDRFISHLENNDVVVVNSGGFEPYLNLFCRKHNIVYCFSTRFKYVNNVFTGRIEGIDCLSSEKVRRMRDTIVLSDSYKNIFVYSDSVTDMPIFNLATHKIAIVKKNTTPKWCQSNFEIINV